MHSELMVLVIGNPRVMLLSRSKIGSKSLHVVKNATPSENRVERLEALWERTRYRLYSPKHLWTWIDLNRRFQMRFIRSKSVRVKVPALTIPHCEECVEICCTGKNAVVSLRLSDIARLKDAGLDAAITHEGKREIASSDSWAALELSWSVFAKTFPVLKRDSTNTCVLLNASLECSAYPNWPLSCARYPYALDALRGEVFFAKGCGSRRMVTLDDPPDSIRRLVDATVRAYNERLRDMILLHTAFDELYDLGLLEHLNFEGKLLKRFERRSRA